MPLTTAQIDRLGERLKAGPLTESDRGLLLEFRTSFLPAYQEAVGKIRAELGMEPTGRPEKTPDSIIAKLRRSDTKLSRMQDIAGCRIVVDGRWQQDGVVNALGRLFEGARVVDRRQDPSYGYRAVHMIVKVQGRQVEIQVRTLLQDQWANAVEYLGDQEGVDFKHGVEVPDMPWLPWLQLTSDCLHHIEQFDDRESEAGMSPAELYRYRQGQFRAIVLVVPYVDSLRHGHE